MLDQYADCRETIETLPHRRRTEIRFNIFAKRLPRRIFVNSTCENCFYYEYIDFALFLSFNLSWHFACHSASLLSSRTRVDTVCSYMNKQQDHSQSHVCISIEMNHFHFSQCLLPAVNSGRAALRYAHATLMDFPL